jgi:hypothetical protein
MKVTERENKYRKLHMASNEAFKGCLQMVSTERKEYAKVYASSRTTENKFHKSALNKETIFYIYRKNQLTQIYP